MKESILVISNANDESLAPVIEKLEIRGERVLRFDTEHFPEDLLLCETLHNGALAGHLAGRGRCGPLIRWEDVKSVWYRRPVRAHASQDLHEGYVRFIQDEAGVALWSLYSCLEALWVNPPLFSSKLLEHNKLYQTQIAARCGLAVPDTIVTNEVAELLAFCDRHDGVVALKRLKGNFFTREGSDVPLLVFTQQVTKDQLEAHADDIGICPVLAQEYIKKTLEFRITIVGDRIFTCAIHSQDSDLTKHDWRRYDFANVRHAQYELPLDIQEKLLRLMRLWNLQFGAIDMALTPDGSYVFFEINSNGQWLWIEELTGMEISTSIAETLAKASGA